jgi:hypothetical protein
MSIRLSQKYGVNPSLELCFFCGKEKGTIVLMGQLKEDAEAPRKAVFNREPCPECQEMMSQGVMFISVRNGEKPSDNPYRTGRLCVIKDEAVQRFLIEESLKSDMLKKRACFLEDEIWDMMGFPGSEPADAKETP